LILQAVHEVIAVAVIQMFQKAKDGSISDRADVSGYGVGFGCVSESVPSLLLHVIEVIVVVIAEVRESVVIPVVRISLRCA